LPAFGYANEKTYLEILNNTSSVPCYKTRNKVHGYQEK